MTEEREDLNDTANIQERNRQNLEISKERLKKELENIKQLIGFNGTEDAVVKSSNVSSTNMIQQAEYNKLKEENKILKSENDSFRLTISMIENENNSLRESVEALKMEQANFMSLSNEVSSLRETIISLESENSTLREKLSEATSEVEKYSNQDLQIESQKLNGYEVPIENAQTSENVKPPQVHQGFSVPPIKSKKLKWRTSSKAKKIDEDQFSSTQSENLSVSSKLDVEKIINETVRRKCPTCFNTNKKFIREFTDKSNIIYDYPRIYGKKFKCNICRTEWK